ncbi:MAG: hypothetical protein ACE5IP_10215 [Terriglobia bacterium]
MRTRRPFAYALVVLLFCALWLWAALPASDDFERATLGANWTQATFEGGNNCTITGSSDATLSAAGQDVYCFWNADVPNAGSNYAFVQLTDTTAQKGAATGIEDGATDDGVACIAGDSTSWHLERYDGGAWAEVTSGAHTWAPGDFIGIERHSANTFRCYFSSDGTSWTALGAADSTVNNIVDPGRAGMVLFATTGSPQIEQWEGGNGALPTGGAPRRLLVITRRHRFRARQQ